MRLNAFIARCGLCSRRNAVLFIKDGLVTVNGKTAREPWLEVFPSDKVSVKGKAIGEPEFSYLVLNKPKGVTSTLKDRFAEKKVTDLIPARFGRLYPIGRLDKDSRGLMILTNDGALCNRLTHPKFETEKEYVVRVDGDIDNSIAERLKAGITDEGETLKVKSARIESVAKGRAVIRVVVCEGRKRHLRRLFSGLGMKVIDLKRVRIGALGLGNLKEGAFKTVDRKTIYRLTVPRGAWYNKK